MNQALHVADRFGGTAALIDACAKMDKPVGDKAVYQWLRLGKIPEKYWLSLLIVARRIGKGLTPYDFVAHLAEEFAQATAADSRGTETSSDSLASQATPA